MLPVNRRISSRTTSHLQPRRGISILETIVILISMISVGTTAYFATPYALRAGNTETNAGSTEPAAWPDETRAAIDALDTLIRKSKNTLLLKTIPGKSRQLEFIVLWLNDEHDPGYLNQAEILVLRHSRLLQSITAYAATKTPPEGDYRALQQRLTSRLRKPQFITEFLRHPATEGRVIGIKIADWRITENNSSDHPAQSVPEHSPGRIELTCVGQSADTPPIASVPTALRPRYRSR